jgi:hypothetical protein
VFPLAVLASTKHYDHWPVPLEMRQSLGLSIVIRKIKIWELVAASNPSQHFPTFRRSRRHTTIRYDERVARGADPGRPTVQLGFVGHDVSTSF